MKSSARISVALFSSFLVAFFCAFLLSQTAASPDPDGNFAVTFEEEPDLDHVCFYVTIANNQDSDDSFPLKPLLNRTSIDIDKAEARLWEEETYEYEVINCKTCEVESQRCITDNDTMEESCEFFNESVMDCGKCGDWREKRAGTRWAEKSLTNSEKSITDMNAELRNQFDDVQLKSHEAKRYKLCYYFNEIPVNPDTGMPGSQGYMYLDVKDSLYYDFEHSSWWNDSCSYDQLWNVNLSSGSLSSGYQVCWNITDDSVTSNFNWTYECVSHNSTRSRFVNGSTINDVELNYSVMHCDATDKWMEVCVMLNRNWDGNNGTIHQLHSCSGFPAKSSGYDTFPHFFDDFEDGDITDWNIMQGSVAISSDYAKGIYSMHFTNLDTYEEWVNKSLIHADKVYQYDVYFADSDDNSDLFNGDGSYLIRGGVDGGQGYVSGCTGTNKTGSYGVGRHKIEFKDVNWASHSFDFYIDGDLLYDDVCMLSTALYQDHIVLGGRGGDRNIYLDNILVREYDPDEQYLSVSNATEVDTTPPSFSNYNRIPNIPNEDQDVVVNVTITDEQGGISTVLLEFNGTVNWTVTTNSGSVYYYTIKSGNYTAHDDVTYVWYATNTFGNLNQSEQQYFTVANRPPSAPSLANPVNNSGVALGSPVPEFNWSPTDPDDEDNAVLVYTFEIYYPNNTLYNQTITTNNHTTPAFPNVDRTYHWRVRANDSYNASGWSENRTFQYANWTITFNLTDSITGEQISTAGPQINFDIDCNSGWWYINNVDNPYTATDKFPPGFYSCTFSDLSDYYAITKNFSAVSNTIIQISMSKKAYLTTEEHTWLEWLYDCWSSGTCKDLLEAVNLTTAQINETVGNIWGQYKRTDQSVVTSESVLSKSVNATSNLTISYSIDVPVKEGYTFGETSGEVRLDYLPIRISYWFLEYPDNDTCYSQGNYSVAPAEPYCQPLTVYTVGQVNSTITLSVDLRPSLPSGTYTIVRNIEIDPEQVWINYGQEVIGAVEVLEENSRPSVSLKNTGTFPEASLERTESEGTDRAQSSITGRSVWDESGIAAMVSIIALIGVAACLVLMKKRNRYQGYSYKPR